MCAIESNPPSTGLVLAGGGALGAFEAGVLYYLYEELARELDTLPRFDLFAGTSVGAFNASFMAACADRPGSGARDLAERWGTLCMEKVLRFRGKELLTLASLVLGKKPEWPALTGRIQRPARAVHPPVAGLFDTSPLFEEIDSFVPWDGLQRNLETGRVKGIALCATEVCTGTSIIFYQTSGNSGFKIGRDPLKEARPVRISTAHVMASAAIPFLFPSIQIDGVCYVDGALRQNTPLNPVLRMGANRILVVSLTQDPKIESRIARIGCRRNPYPGVLFLLGRTVRVFLTQSLDYELGRIELYNKLIEGGCQTYGDSFLVELNRIMGAERNAHYRFIKTCHVRPSRNLHELALQAMRDAPKELSFPGATGKILGKLLNTTAFAESELLSFLLFTPRFITTLLDLGYHDAKAHRERLLELFG
jgi:NTE family protein